MVNADVIREIWNGAESYGANKGVVISLSGFSDEAIKLSQKMKVQLINLSEQDIPSFECISKWPNLDKNIDNNTIIAEHRKTDDEEFERFFKKLFETSTNL